MLQDIQKFIKWWNRPNKSTVAEYVQAFIVIVPIAFIIRTWGYGLYKVPSGSMETTLLVGESFVSDKFTYAFLRDPKRGEIIAFNEPDTERFRYSTHPLKRWWQHYVWGPENWTKRVIGLPGDHIEGKIEDGHPVIYINGEKFDEPYVNKYPLIKQTPNGSYRSYDPCKSFDNQPFYRMNELSVKQTKRLLDQFGIPSERLPGTPLLGAEGSDIFDIHLKSKAKGDDKNEYWVMGDNRLGSADSRSFGPLDGSHIHGRIVFRLFSIDSDYGWILFDLLLHPIDFLTRVRWSRWLQTV